MKSFWIYILAFFPFNVSGTLNANTIQPGFLADRHAKTINSHVSPFMSVVLKNLKRFCSNFVLTFKHVLLVKSLIDKA